MIDEKKLTTNKNISILPTKAPVANKKAGTVLNPIKPKSSGTTAPVGNPTTPTTPTTPATPAATPATPATTPAPSTTPAYPTLKPGEVATPEQIRQMAEAMYNPAYKQALDELTSQETTLGTERDRMRIDTEKMITDEMIKRGMGRSTNYSDRLTQGLADVEQDYMAAINNLGTQKGTLAANYQQQVNAGELNLLQYFEGIRQFNEQMKKRAGSIGGSKSGTAGFTGYDDAGNQWANGVLVKAAPTKTDNSGAFTGIPKNKTKVPGGWIVD